MDVGDTDSGNGASPSPKNSWIQQIICSEKVFENLEFDLRSIFREQEMRNRFIFTKSLRKDLYKMLAETKDLRKICSDILNAFNTYTKKYMFSKESTTVDILWLLVHHKGIPLQSSCQNHILPTISCKTENVPLFPELRLQSNWISWENRHMKRKVATELPSSMHIGLQHIVLPSVPDSYSSQSSVESSDSNDSFPAKKSRMELKKKTENDFREACQRAKNIDPLSHRRNLYRESITLCQVDILILIDTKVPEIGAQVAKHMALISIENIFGAAMSKFELDDDPNKPVAKTYKLLQTNIAIKLMDGFSNIVVTSNLPVWSHICANVRGIITDGTTEFGMDDLNDADYYVFVEKNDEKTDLSAEDLTLSCIAAITKVINESLGLDVSITLNYEMPKNEVSTVDFPITSIIPLYIIRYFIQLNKVTFDSNKKLSDLFKKEETHS